MTTLTYEKEKEIAQEILKLLDGVPCIAAERIIDIVTKNASQNSYIELKPIQTCEVTLSTKKMDELIGLMEEFNRNHKTNDGLAE